MGDAPELQEFAESNLLIVRLVSVAFLISISCTAVIVSANGILSSIEVGIALGTATLLVLTSIAAKTQRAITIASHTLVVSLLFFILSTCFLNHGVSTPPIVAIPFIPALCAKLFKPSVCIAYSSAIFLGLLSLLYLSPNGLVTPDVLSVLYVTWLTIVVISTTLISLYVVLRNKALSRTLKYQSERDFLTGLPNRFKIHEYLFRQLGKTPGNKKYTAVMMIDVDQFKSYNDRNGHMAGDTALVNVANRLQKIAAANDGFVGRYGGEEFIFSATGQDPSKFESIAEDLRQSIAEMKVETSPTQSDSLSITIGLTSNHARPSVSYEMLIREADEALYKGKALGRNRVVLARPIDPNALALDRALEKEQEGSKTAVRKRLSSHRFSLDKKKLGN